MGDFLSWMEASTLGVSIRQAGPWAYAAINLAHILGVAALLGAVLVLDGRLLGLWRHVPLGLLSDATVPVAVTGLGVAIVAGIGLLSTNAGEYRGNPLLAVKFSAIGVGGLNALVLRLVPAWRDRHSRELSLREQRQLAVVGGVSLCCWLTAATAGRMIAYW